MISNHLNSQALSSLPAPQPAQSQPNTAAQRPYLQHTPDPQVADKDTITSNTPRARIRKSIAYMNAVRIDNEAKTLVQQADQKMAIETAKTLVKSLLVHATNGKDEFSSIVHNIDPHSSFGQAWNRLADAFQSEPFLSFAKANNMNGPYLELNPRNGYLSIECDGTRKTFALHLHPGWASASQNVLAALADVAGDSSAEVRFEGRNIAGFQAVANYYGIPGNSKVAYTINELIAYSSFNSLLELNAQKPEYEPVRKRQQQAIRNIENLDSAQFNALFYSNGNQDIASQVNEADRLLAQSCALQILSLRHETRGNRLRDTDMNHLPPLSTFAQTRSALHAELQSEPIRNFLSQHGITDLSGHSIDPISGELTAINDRGERCIFKQDDNSGWKDVSSSVLEKVRSLAAGTNQYIQPAPQYYVTVNEVLNFYGEPRAGTSVAQILQQTYGLLGTEGFPALHKDATPPHPKSAEVQAKQQAVKLHLMADSEAAENHITVNASLPSAQNTQIANEPQGTDNITHPSTPQTSPAIASVSSNPASQISRRLFDGAPSLEAAVTQLLGEAIQQTAPGLDVDVNHLAFSTPYPEDPGQFMQTELKEMVLNHIAGGDAPKFDADGHFVDTRPKQRAPASATRNVPPLIDKQVLERALRELPDKLDEAHRSQLLKYWTESPFTQPAPGLNANSSVSITPLYTGGRRTLIGDLARNNLQLASLKYPGLDYQQRETLRHIVEYPQGSERPVLGDKSAVNVYVLASTEASNPARQQFRTPVLVIERKLQDRTIILACEPDGRVTPYDSLAAALNGLEPPLPTTTSGPLINNALVKTEADPFLTQATIIVNQQLKQAVSTTPVLVNSVQTGKTTEWIAKASDAERIILSKLSMELASFMQLNQGRTYSSDIPDIGLYLNNQLKALSPPPFTEDINNIEVVFHTPVGNRGSSYIERTTWPLIDTFTQNLANLPLGRREVRHKVTKARIPELEVEGALNALIQKMDLGKNYPQLLQRELLDDPAVNAQRQSLFAQQVPIELKIKALQLTSQRLLGFDNATGYRYINAVFDPKPGAKTVDGKEIVIRPFAFVRHAGATPDPVDNTFLIEPKDSEVGPHILYRPLSDTPLQQFPSRQTLMEAIQKPGKLQSDLLAGLRDDSIRDYFSEGGLLPSKLPRTHVPLGDVKGLLNTDAPSLVTDGADVNALETKLKAGQLMSQLYTSNADALVALAKKESVSNSASRWARFKEGSFLLLNAVLPALRGPGAVIGLGLQGVGILGDINTLASKKEGNKEAAVADLLINLSALMLHYSVRQQRKPAGVSESEHVNNAGSFAFAPKNVEPLLEVTPTAETAEVPDQQSIINAFETDGLLIRTLQLKNAHFEFHNTKETLDSIRENKDTHKRHGGLRKWSLAQADLLPNYYKMGEGTGQLARNIAVLAKPEKLYDNITGVHETDDFSGNIKDDTHYIGKVNADKEMKTLLTNLKNKQAQHPAGAIENSEIQTVGVPAEAIVGLLFYPSNNLQTWETIKPNFQKVIDRSGEEFAGRTFPVFTYTIVEGKTQLVYLDRLTVKPKKALESTAAGKGDLNAPVFKLPALTS